MFKSEQSKKTARGREENVSGKSENPERERKKCEFALFSPVAALHWKPGSRAQSCSALMSWQSWQSWLSFSGCPVPAALL
jgi:hypothetical protein